MEASTQAQSLADSSLGVFLSRGWIMFLTLTCLLCWAVCNFMWSGLVAYIPQPVVSSNEVVVTVQKHTVYVVVQFYPWFKFYFPLFQTHYHTLPQPKTKENKI